MSTCWLYELLETHLSPSQLEQVKPFIHSESWVSPAARHRDWINQETPDLRYELHIDVQT
jgi:hypothetical protein